MSHLWDGLLGPVTGIKHVTCARDEDPRRRSSWPLSAGHHAFLGQLVPLQGDLEAAQVLIQLGGPPPDVAPLPEHCTAVR